MFIHWHRDSNNLNRPKCQADHPNFGGIEWKTQKLLVVYSTTNNNQGKKHPGLIGLTNKFQEIEYFTDTIMIKHFITTPLWGMDMWYSTTSTFQKHFWTSSKLRTNHLCLVHQDHLIKTTKYNLGGNIWLHLWDVCLIWS